MKRIKKGNYYWHRDGSTKNAHPSYVYKKNDNKNKYNIVCFTSSKGKHRTKLNENINPDSNNDCYVLRSPRISNRNLFGKELTGFKTTDKIDKVKIRYISNKKKQACTFMGYLDALLLFILYTLFSRSK